jgi:hypothetical protein
VVEEKGGHEDEILTVCVQNGDVMTWVVNDCLMCLSCHKRVRCLSISGYMKNQRGIVHEGQRMRKQLDVDRLMSALKRLHVRSQRRKREDEYTN